MNHFCESTFCFNALEAEAVRLIPSGEPRRCRRCFPIREKYYFSLSAALGTYVTRSDCWQTRGPDLLPTSGGRRASLKPGQQRLLRSLGIWALTPGLTAPATAPAPSLLGWVFFKKIILSYF